MASHIPSASYTSTSFEIPNADPANTAQGAAAPRERRTLHQMEQELNEWAKYPAEGENRIDTKEKILAAYQNPPELLELKNIGFANNTPNLPKCVEDLDCKIECTFLRNNFGCRTAEGTFKYIPELEGMDLAEGTSKVGTSCFVGTSCPNDNATYSIDEHEWRTTSSTGTFQYIPELQGMRLTNGTISKHNAGYSYYDCSSGGRTSPESSSTTSGIFKYIPELKGMELTDGTTQFENGTIWTGKRQYIPELKGMELTDGTVLLKRGDVCTGKYQYIPELKNMYLTDGTYHLKNGMREEGSFKYIEKTKRMELVDGIVTKPDGTRKQLSQGHYSKLFGRMRYTTKKLPPVAPPGPPAKLTLPVPNTTEEASTSTPPTQATESEQLEPENTTRLESQASVSGLVDQDESIAESSPTASTSASPRVPLLVRASFQQRHDEQVVNGLGLAHVPQGEQVLSIKVLPPALQNNRICAQFFGDYAQAMQQLYDKNTADALGYSNIEASPWSRIANAVLTTSGILGLSVCGRLLINLSQLHNETEAANKANSILGHFCMPHQFDSLSSHMAVRLTQALEPQLGVLLSQQTLNTLHPLQKMVNEWMRHGELKPIQNLSPFALLTAMVCMKLLRKTPSADRQTQLSDHYVTELTENLVGKVLEMMSMDAAPAGPSTYDANPDGVWTDVPELHDVPEATSLYTSQKYI